MVSNMVEQDSKTQAETYLVIWHLQEIDVHWESRFSRKWWCQALAQGKKVSGSREVGDQQSLSHENKESNGVVAGGTYVGASEIFIGYF